MLLTESVECRDSLIDQVSKVLFDVLVERKMNVLDIMDSCFSGESPQPVPSEFEDALRGLDEEFLRVADREYFEQQESMHEVIWELNQADKMKWQGVIHSENMLTMQSK